MKLPPSSLSLPQPRPRRVRRSTLGLAAVSAALSLSAGAARAADPAPGTNSPAVMPPPPPPEQRFHYLNNFEFSNMYLTPRGMIVHEDGLTFQWLALGLFNIYKGDSFVNDFTIVGGMWNDFNTDGVSVHAPFGSKPKTSWVEIDPIAGISLGLAKHFKLDVTYTAFNMQVLDIGTSQHLETKVGFDDSSYLKDFALHPYFLYWQELVGKATAAQVPYIVNPLGKTVGSPPGSSAYFEVGVSPGYTFKNIDLKLEAPCRLLMPLPNFYGEYYDASSTVGLYEIGAKASIPLKFMPAGYGSWSFHLGVRYQRFVDDNLQGMQQFNAPGEAVNHATQFYCGVTTFF